MSGQKNKFELVNESSELERLNAVINESDDESDNGIVVSKKRLGVLKSLRDSCHEAYINPMSTPVLKRKAWINYLTEIYIPNVMRDFPYLLDKIFTLTSVVEHLEKELIKTKSQRNKAYDKLGWKVGKYSDEAKVTIDDLSEFYEED